MNSIRHSGPFALALILAGGAFSACSSDATHTGTGGAVGTDASTGTGGTGGSATDAGHDTVVDAVADASSPDVAPSITLTSSALTEGAVFMAANTCAGVNTSPPLTWTAGPSGTMSYALSLTDTNNAAVHWIIWDIPAATTSLAAALPAGSPLATPAGAKQMHYAVFFTAGTDYRGPCPGANGPHTYRFQVSAIPTATLAGVTSTSSTLDIQNLAHGVALALGNLTGTSSATAPPADAAADSSGQ